MPTLTKTPFTKLRRDALKLAKKYEKTVCNQVKLADRICEIAERYSDNGKFI